MCDIRPAHDARAHHTQPNSSQAEWHLLWHLHFTLVEKPSTAIYASETWKSTGKTQRKLNIFHQRCLRKILKITYRNRVTNRGQNLDHHYSESATERRLRLAGHILRLSDTRPLRFLPIINHCCFQISELLQS